MLELNKLLQAQFDKMCATGKLFRSQITGFQVWELYIKNFKAEYNPIFRDPNSTVYNCNLCKNFIRRYGNIIAFDENYNIMTIWDVIPSEEYSTPCSTISNFLKNAPAGEVFFETFNELNSLPYESTNKIQPIYKLGVDKNVKRYTKEEAEKFGVVRPHEVRTFNHLHLFLPTQFVDKSGKSIESLMGDYRDAKNVFQRAMQEIPLDTLHLVRDLINQDSLLDGKTHLHKVERFITLKSQYDSVNPEHRDNWCWVQSYNNQFAKFRNELIGTLCVELAEGVELNTACQTWNKRVDPVNYMKATAPITKKQIEEAKKFVEENDYEASFSRRFATIDDIKASEILHLNVGKQELKNVSIFDSVKSTSTRHKRSEFDNVEEVTIEKFMTDILPTCTSVEAYLTSKHEGNLVSLTTSNNSDSKPIFKWDNNYSWTFNGNLAGKSQIKEAVKGRGGNVEGIIRISMHFPLTTNDYDLHLAEPGGYEIYYGNRRKLSPNGGTLDLDAQGADGHQIPEKRVENIIYQNNSKLRTGVYEVLVHNYSGGGVHTSFTVEIEIDGEITLLQLKTPLKRNAYVASIEYKSNGTFVLTPKDDMVILESNNVSKNIYNLDTNQFHKVNLVCLSPNHWDNNRSGNKHYFFMLENCLCPTSIRSFHNENLIPELLQHRKVMEVLGATNMIEPTNKQLSGLGFNATVRDELIVRLQGSFKRVIKIKF